MSKKVQDKASVRKRGIKELLIGVAIAAVGGLASYASYSSARAGETYTVYTGVIAIGIVYALKGAFDLAFPTGFKKSDSISDDSKKVEAAEADIVKEEE